MAKFQEVRGFLTTEGSLNHGHLDQLEQSTAQSRRSRSSTIDSFSAPDPDEDGISVPLDPKGVWFQWKTLWAYTGPGILMSVAFVDPGNLEADLQAGAYTGYQLVWVLAISTLLGLFMQCLSAKIGVVTGKHLATLCREEYPWYISYVLWIMMEVAIIGSDVQEVMGTAIALGLLFGLPLWIGCVITVLDAFVFLGLKSFGIRSLEVFFMSLVAVMSVAFCGNFSINLPRPQELLQGFVPSMQSYAAPTAIGLMGAVVMPHNIFLHSALVLTRGTQRHFPSQVQQSLKYTYIDASLALAFSFIINLAVIGCFSHNFFNVTCAQAVVPSACVPHRLETVLTEKYGQCSSMSGHGSCQKVGLTVAGDVLEGSLGSTAKYIWAVGLLASGQSSTMTGAYAGQFVFEGFLKTNIPKWSRVLLTRCIALIPALFVAVSSSRNPYATDGLQQWLNILQSFQLPFALFPLLFILKNKKVMKEYAIGCAMAVILAAIILLLLVANVYIVTTSIPHIPDPHFVWILSAIYILIISMLVCYTFKGERTVALYSNI